MGKGCVTFSRLSFRRTCKGGRVSYVFVGDRTENTFLEEGLGSGQLRNYLLQSIVSNLI